MKKINVLYIIESFGYGGREKVVKDLCNHLDLSKFNVSLLLLSSNNNELLKDINKGIKTIELPFLRNDLGGIRSFKLWFSGLPKIISIFNKNRNDIIHSHLMFNHFLLISVAIRLSIKHVLHFRTIHTSGLFYSKGDIANIIRLKTEQFASKINSMYLISISETIYNNNRRLFGNIIKENRLITNGVDLKIFSKIKYTHVTKSDFGFTEKDLIVTYVARLDHGKNHICLLNAWINIINIVPNAKLCLLGDGILLNEMIKKAIDLNIKDSVLFFGTIENVAEFLSITDIGVIPSKFEGFPVSLLEKMAMQIPVIVSDIDIFKEIITHDFDGIICKVNDSNLLGKSIIDLYFDERKRLKLSIAARQTACKFDLDFIVMQHENYYENAINI